MLTDFFCQNNKNNYEKKYKYLSLRYDKFLRAKYILVSPIQNYSYYIFQQHYTYLSHEIANKLCESIESGIIEFVG